MRTAVALARACHPAPTVAVTLLGALLAFAAGNPPWRIALVAVTVLAGQLTIGWSNDLVDADRDRRAGRTDKPLAAGHLTTATLTRALLGASGICLVLSFTLGLLAGLAHLVLVGAGWAYNLGLKRTRWSWVPYAVAFGGLPAVAWLALDPAALPPWWVALVGAILGVAAHLLNALPDFADDAATGVRGFPHRIGARATSLVAVVLLCAGTATVVLAPEGPVPWWAWFALAASLVLSLTALAAGRAWPFRAAMAIALLDVIVLVARS